ncbi:unnamed protein product [Cyclocybe aegerita]|uniref:Uncharacterized protein n=1 Tax=Cyclocybe aegerita TaxID=1973307 RepID=A0A8S0W829_CYCAE|nr:unnamed protein product [Cyclocybe aegerita]
MRELLVAFCELDPSSSVVISILQVLHRQNPGIESFGFDFQGIWQDLSIGLRQAVWDLFQSPHLKSLSLEYIQVPNTLLLGSAVRHLHLDNIESGDMAESMEHLSTSRRSNLKGLPICSQIESLEIDRPDESHLALLCGGSDSSTLGQFIRLRKLTITVYFFEEEYNYIAPLLSRAEETLVDVKILYGSHMDHPVSPPATVDLGRMKRLKNLTLDSSEHDVGTVLHDYNLLLGQLTAPTTLETLNLHVPLDLQDEDHYTALAPLFQSLGAPSDCNVWTSFNDIISAPFRFTGLRQLVVRVQFVQYLVDDCPGSDANFRDLIKTLIRLALPYFSGDDGAPKLVIDFTTR